MQISYLFIHNYDAIKSSFDGNRSIIILGNRGTGKTAILTDLHSSCSPSWLTCFIDDYSNLKLSPSVEEYYRLLIINLVAALFNKLYEEPKRMNCLNKDDKLFLSLLLSEYTSQTTKDELIRKIEAIQLSRFRRFIKRSANFIRAICNYGLTAALNIINDVIRNYFSVIPPIQESDIRNIAPKLDIEADTGFISVEASYKMILRISTITKKLGYERVIVFFDKFDEDSRMKNDAEIISDFIAPLLSDNKLLENDYVQIIISVWEIPFKRILGTVRTQKHYCPVLSWPTSMLIKALNTRVSVFSNGNINDFKYLLDNRVGAERVNEIFSLCNNNPRDLWHIFDRIFQAQYALDSTSDKLTDEAINRGLRDFVAKFNFYEYYPKKPNAKASTMDVYSYIKHLLNLPSGDFTKNQLNALAKTGSSTNNYVVGMENIGLVLNSGEKNNGGVVYRINDPKVLFAIQSGIDIARC